MIRNLSIQSKGSYKLEGRKIPGTDKFLITYRLISWFVTSLFYLLTIQPISLLQKLSSVILLLLSGLVLDKIYKECREDRIKISITVFLETLGIAWLLVPSGFDSPFIWYALNPVFIAATHLPKYASWLTLGFYFVNSAATTYLINNSKIQNITDFFNASRDTILVFILMNFAIQLYSRLIKQLTLQAKKLEEQKDVMIQVNQELAEANKIGEESLKHITDLYQTVEVFCSEDRPEQLVEIFAQYTHTLTGCKPSLFWLAPGKLSKAEKGLCYIHGCNTSREYNEILQVINNHGARFSEKPEDSRSKEYIDLKNIQNKTLLSVKISSTSCFYGYLAIAVDDLERERNGMAIGKKISFLTELCAAVLERFRLAEVSDKLLLAQEQNRIAEEIHDNVSQQLFSISYAAHSLTALSDKIDKNELKQKLNLIRKTAFSASQDLRSSIYKLSLRKNGDRLFVDCIEEYLNAISSLNGISVTFDVSGDIEPGNPELEKMLFRLVREATANAIRHGRCSEINVEMKLESNEIVLHIRDNGEGFQLEILNNHLRGLGVRNMKKLISFYGGKFFVDSKVGQGCMLCCRIPWQNTDFREGERIESGFNR